MTDREALELCFKTLDKYFHAPSQRVERVMVIEVRRVLPLIKEHLDKS